MAGFDYRVPDHRLARGSPPPSCMAFIKTKQYEQALQGLSQAYTIRATIARAYLHRPW
jgi:hypothetical protein